MSDCASAPTIKINVINNKKTAFELNEFLFIGLRKTYVSTDGNLLLSVKYAPFELIKKWLF